MSLFLRDVENGKSVHTFPGLRESSRVQQHDYCRIQLWHFPIHQKQHWFNCVCIVLHDRNIIVAIVMNSLEPICIGGTKHSVDPTVKTFLVWLRQIHEGFEVIRIFSLLLTL